MYDFYYMETNTLQQLCNLIINFFFDKLCCLAHQSAGLVGLNVSDACDFQVVNVAREMCV